MPVRSLTSRSVNIRSGGASVDAVVCGVMLSANRSHTRLGNVTAKIPTRPRDLGEGLAVLEQQRRAVVEQHVSADDSPVGEREFWAFVGLVDRDRCLVTCERSGATYGFVFGLVESRWCVVHVGVDSAAGVGVADLRTAPLERARRWFTRDMLKRLEVDGSGVVSIHSSHVDESARIERRRTTRAARRLRYRAEVAARYVELVADGLPHPTQRLADELGVASGRDTMSTSRVRQLLVEARRDDLLTMTEPGRPGGELTDKALAILADGEPERGTT